MATQLIYAYIQEYKGIREQGFNLNSKYKVDLIFDEFYDQYGIPMMIINVQESDLPHLFHPQISDIKGIVGENGSGKSSLLQFLSYSGQDHSVNRPNPSKFRDILVYEVTEFGVSTLQVAVGVSWRLEEFKTRADTPDGTQFESMNELYYEELEGFSKADFIYYSNVFDYKIEEPYGSLRSVSTNYLMRIDQERLTNGKVTVDSYQAFRTQEARRHVEFVLQFRNVLNLPVNIPKQIYLTGNSFAFQSLKKKLPEDANLGETFYRLLNAWLERTEGTPEQSNPKLKGELERTVEGEFKKRFLHYFIDNLIAADEDLTNHTFPDYPSYKLRLFARIICQWSVLNGDFDIDYLIEYSRNEELRLEQNPKNQTVPGTEIPIKLGDSSLSVRLQRFKDFFDFLFRGKVNVISTNHRGLSILLDDNTLELYRLYLQSLYITSYLDFTFPELSSGELGMITIFSRFYSLVSGAHPGLESKAGERNLIIFIDEGDLYFHPSWQAKFIDYINEMLPVIFPGDAMQIFITSHSPFIASDLTPDHLLFMKKIDSDNKHTKEVQSYPGGFDLRDKIAGEVAKEPEYTFAANIHDLLSHSFFMKGAHMGELAKKTLFKMLDQMDGKVKQAWFSDEQLLALIDVIGEPWMRSRLMEKFKVYTLKNQTL